MMWKIENRQRRGKRLLLTEREGNNKNEEESEDSLLSIGMRSTLSDAEFISVESSITTDQEAFAHKPGIVKRTASFVKNPLRRTRSKKREEDELMKRMKHARNLARADNRRREKFDANGHPVKSKNDDESSETDINRKRWTNCSRCWLRIT